MGRDWAERTHGERKMCFFFSHLIRHRQNWGSLGTPANGRWKEMRVDQAGWGMH